MGAWYDVDVVDSNSCELQSEQHRYTFFLASTYCLQGYFMETATLSPEEKCASPKQQFPSEVIVPFEGAYPIALQFSDYEGV